jgi:histidinol-phosphate/aromatic aminotransferase/cobyric acid decarboxylase-like protein
VLTPEPALAARVRRRQPRWSVNALACAILPELLAAADPPAWAHGVAALRHELDSLLARHGIAADPSDANYLLVRAAPGLRDHLARRGILVRDTASFGLPTGARVAVPDRLGLDRVRDALDGWTR